MAKKNKKSTEDVTILEEHDDRSCRNCGVRFESGKLSEKIGKDEAIKARIPICGRCAHNPNMALVKSIPGSEGIIKQFFGGEVVDNWRPITDGDKSCLTCKTKRTVNALGMCAEAKKIVEVNCLLCKFSKNAALIEAAHKNVGMDKPLEDHWISFEA